jgi:putative acyl-CoA dehydrogenase
VRTIIEMVAMTRFDCMVGSSAGQRAAVAQALHHCAPRARPSAACSSSSR